MINPMSIDIIVKNNCETVFCGKAEQWFSDNDNDMDILEMILECEKEGYSARHFISGFWQCIYN